MTSMERIYWQFVYLATNLNFLLEYRNILVKNVFDKHVLTIKKSERRYQWLLRDLKKVMNERDKVLLNENIKTIFY